MPPGFTPQKMEFAAKLKSARKAANMSQERAAAAVGTSRRHWIRWESGEMTPNPAYLDRIADVLAEPTLADAVQDEEESSSMPLARDMVAVLMPSEALRRIVREELASKANV